MFLHTHNMHDMSSNTLTSVNDVRVLRGLDVIAIVEGTPRLFGRRVRVVVGQEARERYYWKNAAEAYGLALE